jgi:hypothetical protein
VPEEVDRAWRCLNVEGAEEFELCASHDSELFDLPICAAREQHLILGRRPADRDARDHLFVFAA